MTKKVKTSNNAKTPSLNIAGVRLSNLSTDEILELNEKRFISNTTGMNCSKCGTDFKVSNRHILPFEFEILNGNIGKIWIPCPRCDEKYDLGICRYY